MINHGKLPKIVVVYMLSTVTDLVPRDNIEKWLKYLRNEFPVVAFKASTQSQSDRLVCTGTDFCLLVLKTNSPSLAGI